MVKVAMTKATAHHDELRVTYCALSVGKDVEKVHFEGGRQPLKSGNGAMVVQADDVNGFACALEMLLSNDDLRKTMGQNAYHVTVPYFTWQNRVTTFLEEIGVNCKAQS
jgi:glycosyltransferase involved in cell wall biosynthesis